MLSKEDFKPVTLEDKAFFEHHYALYPQTHSINTFTNLICWNHIAHYSYAYVNGNLILSSAIEGKLRFHPPIGYRDPELMRELIKLAQDVGGNTPLMLIEPETAKWI